MRLATNRNQDMRMNGGRAETEVEYDIGFDDTGRIHALEIQVTASAVPSAELPPMTHSIWAGCGRSKSSGSVAEAVFKC